MLTFPGQSELTLFGVPAPNFRFSGTFLKPEGLMGC